MTFNEFKQRITGKNNQRRWKVTNSYNIYDIYKYIRKNNWFNIGQPITEHQFYTIIRTIGDYLVSQLLSNHSVRVPYLGRFDIVKQDTFVNFKNNKLVTNYPIDWNATLRLWYNDKEAFNNKLLVRKEQKYLYYVYWDRKYLRFNNKFDMSFKASRGLTKRLSQLIDQGKIEAFQAYKYDRI